MDGLLIIVPFGVGKFANERPRSLKRVAVEDEAGRAIFPFHLEVDRTLEHAVAPDRHHLELAVTYSDERGMEGERVRGGE